jgi:hypothetical protein
MYHALHLTGLGLAAGTGLYFTAFAGTTIVMCILKMSDLRSALTTQWRRVLSAVGLRQAQQQQQHNSAGAQPALSLRPRLTTKAPTARVTPPAVARPQERNGGAITQRKRVSMARPSTPEVPPPLYMLSSVRDQSMYHTSTGVVWQEITSNSQRSTKEALRGDADQHVVEWRASKQPRRSPASEA